MASNKQHIIDKYLKDRQRRLSLATQRPAPLPSILITGGIGDFIIVESFVPNPICLAVATVYYATRQQIPIKSLISSVACFTNIRNHVSLWDDYADRWCFTSKQELLNDHCPKQAKRLAMTGDWSIGNVFERINKRNLQYKGSSLLRKPLANVAEKFLLPPTYYCACAQSADARMENRHFTDSDWTTCINIANGIPVVLLGVADQIPHYPLLIDLTDKTTLLESIAIIRNACGYIGIDSWLSVLSAQLFRSDQLHIKSNNQHCYDCKHIYYAPHKEFTFLQQRIA